MSGQDDESDKSFEASAQKLQKAREKGEIAKSNDLNVAAVYLGVVIVLAGAGSAMIQSFGQAILLFLDRPDQLSQRLFEGPSTSLLGTTLVGMVSAVAPLFVVPAMAVVAVLAAQKAFIFAPAKIQPKLSRISILSNAKQKFGRSGLFEFGKSFAKLLIYSLCLAVFLHHNLELIIGAAEVGHRPALSLMAQLMLKFLAIAFVVAAAIGVVDFIWQRAEHLRKNRMSRKELTDETKDSEGDPHMKGHRRQKAQEIAMNRMMAEVPGADVIIVNPTHYAVALKWNRLPGSAPTCIAKGVDEIAARIRETGTAAGVPIHSDPPTARALHATVEVGSEIDPEYYRAVAAAIRFAEDMRNKAKGRVT